MKFSLETRAPKCELPSKHWCGISILAAMLLGGLLLPSARADAKQKEVAGPSVARQKNTILDADLEHELYNVLRANADVKFLGVEAIPGFKPGKYKWVGGAYATNGKVYTIPTGASSILEIDPISGQFCHFGKLGTDGFKWTRAVVHTDGMIYGLLRRKNTLLKIDPFLQKVEELDLGLSYPKEHHYGGVLAKNGKIYQPPRNTNHVLVIDPKTQRTYRLGEKLLSKNDKRNFYSGTVPHPNGKVYFLPPVGGRILVLDPATEKLEFMDGEMKFTLYSCAVAPNNCMYGFGTSGVGILKIDPKNKTVQTICKEIGVSGSGDAKLGINGKIYSICLFRPSIEADIWLDHNPIAFANDPCDAAERF